MASARIYLTIFLLTSLFGLSIVNAISIEYQNLFEDPPNGYNIRYAVDTSDVSDSHLVFIYHDGDYLGGCNFGPNDGFGVCSESLTVGYGENHCGSAIVNINTGNDWQGQVCYTAPTPCSYENEPCGFGCCEGFNLQCVPSGICRQTTCSTEGFEPDIDFGCCGGLSVCSDGRCHSSCCEGECCNVGGNSWTYWGPPYTGGCEKCGTVYRWCDGNRQYTGTYDCRDQGSCSPGQESYGGSCGAGNCGTWTNSCGGNCGWEGWNCVGGNSNAGQSCGSCGRGTYDCNGNCNGDYSNCGNEGWVDESGCGNCGHYQRYCNGCDWTNSYQCINQGSCSPGASQSQACGLGGTQSRTCTSSCGWGS
ncbi:MAG TPA: hypothetical protein VJJ52_03035, partial [Candidatus Nanoarchaeia archaeon]|nr:hypothetical protein [Candidatus Nanoarchaeia archaeon]